MDDYDIECSRSSKRRCVNGNIHDASRYSSPDELAASSDHDVSHLRRTSTTIRRESGEFRRRSYTTSNSEEESPDELDHTIHTFYRGGRGRTRTFPPSISSRAESLHTARARSPPEKKKVYNQYRQKSVLKGHRKGVAAVKFSPDGRCIASCCKQHLSEMIP